MELKTFLIPLRKWWWLVLLATVVAGVSSYLAVRQQPTIYQSRVTLMIGSTIDDPNPSGMQLSLSQQLAQSYANIARREPVRRAAAEALGLSRLPDYTVNALLNTQLLEIVVVDTDPARAQAVADELANQLVRQSPSGLQQEDQERQTFINGQLDILQTDIQETQAEISAKQEELGRLFSATDINQMQTEISALQAKLNTLQANFASLLSSSQRGAINALTIIEPASLPLVPVGPQIELSVLMAAAVGFVLASGAAYLLEYLDDTIKSFEELTALTDLPTLGSIPHMKGQNGEHALITISDPRSPISEAFRVLRTAIQFSALERPNRTILVTSSKPLEGKSFTAANLAVVMAQSGHRVLLIDADLRRSIQHEHFGLEKEHGLTSLLLFLDLVASDPESLSAVQLEDFVQHTGEEGLYLVTSGPTPPNPSELLGSNKMKIALASLSQQFDFIVIDSPPILAVTDAVILSAVVDNVLLVVDSSSTRQRELKRALGHLRDVNARLLGTVLNQLATNEMIYGAYYNYYHRQVGDHDNAGGNGSSRLRIRRKKKDSSLNGKTGESRDSAKARK